MIICTALSTRFYVRPAVRQYRCYPAAALDRRAAMRVLSDVLPVPPEVPSEDHAPDPDPPAPRGGTARGAAADPAHCRGLRPRRAVPGTRDHAARLRHGLLPDVAGRRPAPLSADDRERRRVRRGGPRTRNAHHGRAAG